MAKIKVLSLLQPWAELVVIGAKKIETRGWNTQYRGELYIHSSAKFLQSDLDLRLYDKNFAEYLTDDVVYKMKLGHIIGKVELHDVHSTNDSLLRAALNSEEKSFGDYSENRYAWRLRNPVKFKSPKPAKGALSIWEFEHDDLHCCTKCQLPSEQLRTEHKHNIDGHMVNMMEPGERLCPECCANLKLPNLHTINEQRKAPLHSYYNEVAEQQYRNQKLK